MSQKLHRFPRRSTRTSRRLRLGRVDPPHAHGLTGGLLRRFYGDFMGVWLNGLVFQGKSSPETMAFPMEYRGNSEETMVFPWNMGKSSPETMVFTIKYAGFRLNLSHDPILWLTWFHWIFYANLLILGLFASQLLFTRPGKLTVCELEHGHCLWVFPWIAWWFSIVFCKRLPGRVSKIGCGKRQNSATRT